jgi:hypothetical protein
VLLRLLPLGRTPVEACRHRGGRIPSSPGERSCRRASDLDLDSDSLDSQLNYP